MRSFVLDLVGQDQGVDMAMAYSKKPTQAILKMGDKWTDQFSDEF